LKYQRPFLTDEEIEKIAQNLAEYLKDPDSKESTIKFLKAARERIEASREMWRKAHEFPPDILTRRY